MEYLMYTDIPVIKIAMNNGFASVAAFNKVFKVTNGTVSHIMCGDEAAEMR